MNLFASKDVDPMELSISNAKISWLQNELQKASLPENDAFAFLKADNNGDVITYSAFCEALHQVFKYQPLSLDLLATMNIKNDFAFIVQVNLVGQPYGLSFQETNDLWKQADVDGNGVVNYEEFKVF